jgi:hypothetical protein
MPLKSGSRKKIGIEMTINETIELSVEVDPDYIQGTRIPNPMGEHDLPTSDQNLLPPRGDDWPHSESGYWTMIEDLDKRRSNAATDGKS